MKKLKACTLTVLLSALTFAQESRATAMAPPLEAQVNQVTQWFTGFFDNSEQIASNPSVPFISLSSCSVQLIGSNPTPDAQNIYLEQESPTGFERLRFYEFSKDTSAVLLSVHSFLNPNLLRGTCNKAESERIVNINNVVATSCNLELFLEPDPTRYIGNNYPNGCPTSSGGKVISYVTISENSINSLDQIFTPTGQSFGTPIEFRRSKSVPESASTLGLLALGLWGTSSALRRKQKQKSTRKQKALV